AGAGSRRVSCRHPSTRGPARRITSRGPRQGASSMYPENLRYTKDHEWVRIEGERGTVGITHHAQKQLGDVVFLELPEVGRALRAGEGFGTVESVKAVSELFAPLAGEVVETNAALASAPEAINADPYGK